MSNDASSLSSSHEFGITAFLRAGVSGALTADATCRRRLTQCLTLLTREDSP
jgi:hypothetical protein